MTTDTDGLVEKVARIIDPVAFKSHKALFDHCIAQGDTEDMARKYADMTYGENIDRAWSLAKTAIAAVDEAQSARIAELEGALERAERAAETARKAYDRGVEDAAALSESCDMRGDTAKQIRKLTGGKLSRQALGVG